MNIDNFRLTQEGNHIIITEFIVTEFDTGEPLYGVVSVEDFKHILSALRRVYLEGQGRAPRATREERK